MIAIEAVGLRKSFGAARAGAARAGALRAGAARAGAAPTGTVREGKRRAGPVRALRGVDLTVPRGGVCALLGPIGPARRQWSGYWPRCSGPTRVPPGSSGAT